MRVRVCVSLCLFVCVSVCESESVYFRICLEECRHDAGVLMYDAVRGTLLAHEREYLLDRELREGVKSGVRRGLTGLTGSERLDHARCTAE